MWGGQGDEAASWPHQAAAYQLLALLIPLSCCCLRCHAACSCPARCITTRAPFPACTTSHHRAAVAYTVLLHLPCCFYSLQLSRALRDHARSIPGKAQLFINAYAKALEAIPRQLCDNAGFDATDVLNKLRQKHALADGSGKVSQCSDESVEATCHHLPWKPAFML